MSKITLEFDAETERRQAFQALHALDYYCALCDIWEAVRQHRKYGKYTVEELLDIIQETAWDAQQLGEE